MVKVVPWPTWPVLSPSASLGINSVEGGLLVYRPDEQGVVEVITDGTRLWVETER